VRETNLDAAKESES